MDNQSALTTPLTVGDQIMRTETNILVVTQGQGKRKRKWSKRNSLKAKWLLTTRRINGNE